VALVKSGIADPAILVECAVQADALLAMAPDAPYGHALHGYISFERGNHPDAVRHFRAALEREPNDADTLFWLTVTYWQAGHMAGAEATSRQMMASDPLSPLSWAATGITEWFAGRFPGSVSMIRRALELDPENYIHRWTMGYTCALVGDLPGVAEEVKWLVQHGPMVPYTWQLQSLLASLQRDQARGLEALAPVNTAPLDFHLSFHLAESYALAGATERALAVLEEAVDKGFYAHAFMTKYCPFMAPLRGMPEFERIMEKARGRWEAFGRTVTR
jgi:predicted Zn-dependent protease